MLDFDCKNNLTTGRGSSILETSAEMTATGAGPIPAKLKKEKKMNTTTTIGEINQIAYFVNGALLGPLVHRKAILEMALTNLQQIGLCADELVEARRQSEIRTVLDKIDGTEFLESFEK